MSVGIVAQVLSIVFGVFGTSPGASAAAHVTTVVGVAVPKGACGFGEQAMASATDKMATVILTLCMVGLLVSKRNGEPDVLMMNNMEGALMRGSRPLLSSWDLGARRAKRKRRRFMTGSELSKSCDPLIAAASSTRSGARPAAASTAHRLCCAAGWGTIGA